MTLTRREMLTICGAVGLSAAGPHDIGRAAGNSAAVRTITSGPKHHWFGYYDKFEFDPSNRYVLAMEVDFEHRSPRPDDEIRVGMVDLAASDRWFDLGSTTAWCWQQGCMLQWLPGSRSEVIWNDRSEEQYVSHVLDVHTKQRRSLPSPVYSVSADGQTAVTPDFRRINDVRPGYGYTGPADPYANDLAPEETGIFRVNLTTGGIDLVISLAQIAAVGNIPGREPGIKHYFNHLLCSPYGRRFIFLHRWRYPNGKRQTRMLTANPDGTDIRILDDNGLTSHFIWQDADHILAWSRQPEHGEAFYLFEDGGDKVEVVGQHAMTADGHCNYLPGGRWIVNDAYPDKNRNQEVYLFDRDTKQRLSLGRFHCPPSYRGEWRCDTHPRVSRDGKKIVIDAPHADQGRQLHLIDVEKIVA